MNAFYEHHKDSIRFGYCCFDRILLNGLIQPFQQPERVVGFFSRRVAPRLPAVVLGSELEIAKGVGPRLSPSAIALLFFSIALVRGPSGSYPSAEGRKTNMSRPDWMGAIR